MTRAESATTIRFSTSSPEGSCSCCGTDRCARIAREDLEPSRRPVDVAVDGSDGDSDVRVGIDCRLRDEGATSTIDGSLTPEAISSEISRDMAETRGSTRSRPTRST